MFWFADPDYILRHAFLFSLNELLAKHLTFVFVSDPDGVVLRHAVAVSAGQGWQFACTV